MEDCDDRERDNTITGGKLAAQIRYELPPTRQEKRGEMVRKYTDLMR